MKIQKYEGILIAEVDKLIEKKRILKEMDNLGEKYDFERRYSSLIIKRLRNSLAHGYVHFKGLNDINDLSNAFVVFEDRSPKDTGIVTFKGEIRIIDLINILTNKKNVDNIYNVKKYDKRLDTKDD